MLLIDDEVRTLSALAFATSNCNYDLNAFAKRTHLRRRPYRDEYTGSLPNSEVNRRRALSVGEWGTVSEAIRVLPAFLPAFKLENWISGSVEGSIRRRPYRYEYTGSLSNSEVNRRRAQSVGEWGTVSEAFRVLPAFIFVLSSRRFSLQHQSHPSTEEADKRSGAVASVLGS